MATTVIQDGGASGIACPLSAAGIREDQTTLEITAKDAETSTLLTQVETQSDAPADIIITATPDGILIASEDVEALNVLEDLITNVAVGSPSDSRYSLFYLKHLEAEQAQMLIESLFSGGSIPAASSSGDTRDGALGLLGGRVVLSGVRVERVLATFRVDLSADLHRLRLR